MTISPIPTQAKGTSDPHLKLTEAHHEAARLTRLLHERLVSTFQIDLADTQKQAIQIDNALQRVANSERACGFSSGQDHTFANSYQAILEHHRLVYIDFERLSRELENNLAPRCSNITTLAADIDHHLDAAETAHRSSIWPTSLKRAR